MNQKDQSIINEVQSRLDDLFGDEEETIEIIEEVEEIDAFPFRNLKALVLSIDWEISDEIMTAFIREIESLKAAFKKDKILVLFMQLLGILGKYIRDNGAEAHPDSIKVLNSAYESLERIALSEGMSESEKKRILNGEVDKFKRLKEKVSVARTAVEKEAEKAAPIPAVGSIPEALLAGTEARIADKMPPHEAFALAVEEMKQIIRAEFQALRAELRLWRNA